MCISKRILLVEDEATVVMAMQACFEMWGHEVCSIVATGRDAIEAVKREKYDVILMDINLAGEMNGIETAKIIHSEINPKIGLIFMTGYRASDYVEQLAEIKPIAFLEKPIDNEVLRKCLELSKRLD